MKYFLCFAAGALLAWTGLAIWDRSQNEPSTDAIGIGAGAMAGPGEFVIYHGVSSGTATGLRTTKISRLEFYVLSNVITRTIPDSSKPAGYY